PYPAKPLYVPLVGLAYFISLTENNELSITVDENTEFTPGESIDIECRVQRISQRKQAPGNFTPQDSYTWNKATIAIKLGDSMVDIKEISAADRLIISPNPVTYGFTLNIDHSSALKIYSLSGMAIYSGKFTPGEFIDVRTLPSGIYLIEVPGYPVAKLIKK
ncbi:MAG: T9SS type A sorting domain-containing protein, partial [Muribaculaceae bacterium]|nr:T9SS type A sorting domain-containing protein [Muribaculaceae bacterium]